MPRTASPVGLSASKREKLELIAGRPKSSQRDAKRARIILLCAEGKNNIEVASLTGTCVQTVGKWRERFVVERLAGLTDAPRSRAPRTISDKTVEEVLTKTLEGVPGHLTHWSRRKMAREMGIGQTSAGRIWRTFGVKPPCGPRQGPDTWEDSNRR